MTFSLVRLIVHQSRQACCTGDVSASAIAMGMLALGMALLGNYLERW
jgi:hypothetical protein